MLNFLFLIIYGPIGLSMSLITADSSWLGGLKLRHFDR